MRFSVLVAPLLALLVFLSPPALAEGNEAAFANEADGWEQTLDTLAEEIALGDLTAERYDEIRRQLLDIIEAARGASGAAAGTVAITQQMIDALGAPPEEGQPPEPEAITQQRERLGASLAEFNGRVRQADLAVARAEILLSTANEQRLGIFTANLFRRGALPLIPETWEVIPDQIVLLHDLMFDRDRAERVEADPWPQRILLILAGVLAFAVGLPLRRWLARRFGHDRPINEPSYRQQVLGAVVETVVRGLMPAIATFLALTVTMAALGDHPFAGVLRPILQSLALGCIFFFFGAGLARAVLAPQHPNWRLTAIASENLRPLARRFTIIAAAFGLILAVMSTLDRILVPPEIFAVVFFGLTVLGAIALLPALPGRLWQRKSKAALEAAPAPAPEPTLTERSPTTQDRPPAERATWSRLRSLAFLATLVTVTASGLGYHNLARYVAQIFIAGSAAAGVVLLLRGVLRETLELFVNAKSGRIARWRRTLFPKQRGLRFFHYIVAALLDIFILILWVLLLLPVSGIAWSELETWGLAFLSGVEVGGIVIAPGDILMAILAFFIAMTVTRFIQRRLDERLLSKLDLDRGVQNSITTGFGYLCVLIALLISIGTLGLDLTNLALIAGALSVGIGFGLQNVVQNFVAGLILLVERPIKVGDWVVVGDKEGTVKRISVRATEIQTFQRASVIIPNADFVSTAVVNWTHKDKMARVDIDIGVDYGTDLKKVREVLLGCAADQPHVLRYPPPVVVFRNFGASSLDFQLRVFVGDVDYYLEVSSGIRFLIAERFEKEGISIPFNQQVMHIPQLEKLIEQLKAAGIDPAASAKKLSDLPPKD